MRIRLPYLFLGLSVIGAGAYFVLRSRAQPDNVRYLKRAAETAAADAAQDFGRGATIGEQLVNRDKTGPI